MATAAHADVVAHSSFTLATFLFLIGLIFFGFIAETGNTYDRNTLIGIGKGGAGSGLTADFFQDDHCPLF